MNALATVLSATTPTSTAASAASNAPARGDDNDADAGGFAHCMAHARQARADAPRSDKAAAPKDGERAADEALGDTPVDAQACATDPGAAPPDLAALLPGWSAAPSATPGVPAAAPQGATCAEAVSVVDPKTPKAVVTVAGADASSAGHAVALATPAAASPVTPERGHEPASPASAPAREPVTRAPAESRATPADVVTPALPAAAAPAPIVTASARAPDSAPPMAHLPAPIDTPAFAPALATQVRWWAHDGVQQAQLTLSPPEMGPVSVKIVLQDQREARIDFVADVAATRSALEAALPVLAAALDESGLKLTGGGVHDGAAQRDALWQQAQQQPQATRGTSATGTGHSVTTTSTEPGARAQASRGLVDLVA